MLNGDTKFFILVVCKSSINKEGISAASSFYIFSWKKHHLCHLGPTAEKQYPMSHNSCEWGFWEQFSYYPPITSEIGLNILVAVPKSFPQYGKSICFSLVCLSIFSCSVFFKYFLTQNLLHTQRVLLVRYEMTCRLLLQC
jgi:hypothetical protein